MLTCSHGKKYLTRYWVFASAFLVSFLLYTGFLVKKHVILVKTIQQSTSNIITEGINITSIHIKVKTGYSVNLKRFSVFSLKNGLSSKIWLDSVKLKHFFHYCLVIFPGPKNWLSS